MSKKRSKVRKKKKNVKLSKKSVSIDFNKLNELNKKEDETLTKDEINKVSKK